MAQRRITDAAPAARKNLRTLRSSLLAAVGSFILATVAYQRRRAPDAEIGTEALSRRPLRALVYANGVLTLFFLSVSKAL